MDKYWMINLQLMAEGAEGPSSEGTAEPAEAEEAVQTDANELEDLEAEFDALVKGAGKFREVFGKRVKKASYERSKGLRATVDRFNSFAPALEIMAARYGMSVDDPGLADRIANDKSLLENLAMENGSSPDVEYQLARARSAQKQAEDFAKQVMAEREMNTWLQQAEEMKDEYPEFDLHTEMQNPEFQKLLQNGVTMEGAYMALHFGDVKARLTARAEKKVTDAVAAGAKRPRENGMGSQSGAAMTADPAKMSKEEFNDYIRRIERGERISFSRS